MVALLAPALRRRHCRPCAPLVVAFAVPRIAEVRGNEARSFKYLRS